MTPCENVYVWQGLKAVTPRPNDWTAILQVKRPDDIHKQ